MTTERVRPHNAVTRLITRVCDEPVSLQPSCMPALARELPKTPLSRHTATTVTCRGNQKHKQHMAFGLGLGFFGLFVVVWQCRMPKSLSLPVTRKNPNGTILLASSLRSFILGGTMKTMPCKGKWLLKRDWAERVFLTRIHKHLETPRIRYPQSLIYEPGPFLPSLFISFSSNGSSLGAGPEKDKVGVPQ